MDPGIWNAQRRSSATIIKSISQNRQRIRLFSTCTSFHIIFLKRTKRYANLLKYLLGLREQRQSTFPVSSLIYSTILFLKIKDTNYAMMGRVGWQRIRISGICILIVVLLIFHIRRQNDLLPHNNMYSTLNMMLPDHFFFVYSSFIPHKSQPQHHLSLFTRSPFGAIHSKNRYWHREPKLFLMTKHQKLNFSDNKVMEQNLMNEIDHNLQMTTIPNPTKDNPNHMMFWNDTNITDQDPFISSMVSLRYSNEQQQKILNELISVGLWSNTAIPSDHIASTTRSNTLITICHDLDTNILSNVFIQDFGISVLVAHQIRAAIQHVGKKGNATNLICNNNNQEEENKNGVHVKTQIHKRRKRVKNDFKSCIVNEIGQRRMKRFTNSKKVNSSVIDNDMIENKASSTTSNYFFLSTKESKIVSALQKDQQTSVECYEYSLSNHDQILYPILMTELNDFYQFMTIPSILSREDNPIRIATANIYMKHAKQFLGWYIRYHFSNNEKLDPVCINGNPTIPFNQLSFNWIVPNKTKHSASIMIDYILWLRTERQISKSYEANILRGLAKLLKFRFRHDSATSSDDGSTTSSSMNRQQGFSGSAGYNRDSFSDIPALLELRKLHRLANNEQSFAPRISNEYRKWISWPEYLTVVESLRYDLKLLLKDYSTITTPLHDEASSQTKINSYYRFERRIASSMQEYLMLAFLAHIPDRQRTLRELQFGLSFVRYTNGDGYDQIKSDDMKTNNTSQCQWCIKHSPDMYKTGRTYGERPLIFLPIELNDWIDQFWYRWRPILITKSSSTSDHNYFFVQTTTGNPCTENTIYRTVVRACYQYTGKRTNPHLLRDMIVTHVRESTNVTEQQLESLALYMGHSINVQRKSYDRRTLSKKVAPAIDLMNTINSQFNVNLM